jgi:long-chain acyl-CoA synthetase
VVFDKTSTQEYIEQANAVSRALLRMGIKKNDKIAVISSSNRTEWNIMDIGVLQTGAKRPYTQQSLKMIMNTY